MSTTHQPDQQTGGHRRAPDDRDAIDLGRGRRGWLLPLVIGLAVIAVAVGLFLKYGGGSDEKAVDGSHFSNNFVIAYQASSASEQAFLEYLNEEIAPDHGITIEPVGIEDGNQLDQATADGKYIANIYQHKHWLKQVTDATGMELTALGPVFQWSYSMYSSKHD